MSGFETGRVIFGPDGALPQSVAAWQDMPVDQVMRREKPVSRDQYQTTLASEFSATGHGTYTGKAYRTLQFLPYEQEGWWFDRADLEHQLPIRVTPRNVWTTVRSIVLRSGNPHNYMRMVEHIIAHRLGMGLDNVLIRVESGDPPLFDVGSMDIVEGIEQCGIVEQKNRPLKYYTVKEPVTVTRNDSFLTIHPAESGDTGLYVDCAIDFDCAIGKQRIQFDLDSASFRHGAHARTNCTFGMMLLTKTVGKLFADTRNLGYSPTNILIAKKKDYYNEPQLLHKDKSLEAVWHRAILDLVAALSLQETGRICGKVYSYKAGHALDCDMMTKLLQLDLMEEV